MKSFAIKHFMVTEGGLHGGMPVMQAFHEKNGKFSLQNAAVTVFLKDIKKPE